MRISYFIILIVAGSLAPWATAHQTTGNMDNQPLVPSNDSVPRSPNAAQVIDQTFGFNKPVTGEGGSQKKGADAAGIGIADKNKDGKFNITELQSADNAQGCFTTLQGKPVTNFAPGQTLLLQTASGPKQAVISQPTAAELGELVNQTYQNYSASRLGYNPSQTIKVAVQDVGFADLKVGKKGASYYMTRAQDMDVVKGQVAKGQDVKLPNYFFKVLPNGNGKPGCNTELFAGAGGGGGEDGAKAGKKGLGKDKGGNTGKTGERI